MSRYYKGKQLAKLTYFKTGIKQSYCNIMVSYFGCLSGFNNRIAQSRNIFLWQFVNRLFNVIWGLWKHKLQDLGITKRVTIIFAKDKVNYKAAFAKCNCKSWFAYSAALNKNKSFCVIVRVIMCAVVYLLP